MDYYKLLDLTTELGYRLAMSGAETFRVEESISRVLRAYGIESESFVIPNYMTVSIETDTGKPLTIVRRIGYHGNDLDAVERFSNLSRKLCAEHPDAEIFAQWLEDTKKSQLHYSLPLLLLGDFLGAGGFGMFYGGTWVDGLCAGLCGILVGLICKFLDMLHANPFFQTLAASFLMAVAAYLMGLAGLANNPDAVVIGALMILVPGLIFTNAMRDIIYGDTNSGINRIVQVFLIAAAIALGTATALNLVTAVIAAPAGSGLVVYSFFGLEGITCLVGCIGFAILFNIHGPGGLLCALGGLLTWAAYRVSMALGTGDITACFWAAFFASAYAETMARIRKYPAISYLVVSIFPLIPGAGVYYTMLCAVQGDMVSFSERGTHTVAIAGAMAVGILLVSTSVRLWGEWKTRLKK